MIRNFDYFVVFAEMRTGSNFLEANLNLFEGVTCHGEAFNPHFIAYPNKTELFGLTQDDRDTNPLALLDRIKSGTGGLDGFRYFHDHDPRILAPMLDDPRCAKIVLTRNPVESYVSWKIAQTTGQWKLTNVAKRKVSRATFDAEEFDAHVAALQDFQLHLLNGLQSRGQTAFYIGYEDLNNLDVMNGLARWLGCAEQLEDLDTKMKRQNPEPLASKVGNFGEMEGALARYDRFDLTRTPNFEPRRGPLVPGYVAAAQAPVMFLPIRSAPEQSVLSWLASLDNIPVSELQTSFNQKSLRGWLKRHPGHRRFTVLRHPVARAHHAFCTKVLPTGDGGYPHLRRKLINRHALPIPESGPDESGYDLAAHRTAFKAFLSFLKLNLDQQTNVRIDAHWCSQTSAIQGMAEFAMPDILVREETMAAYLPAIAEETGCHTAAEPLVEDENTPFALAHVYDDEIEQLSRNCYQRDYLNFGFADWA